MLNKLLLKPSILHNKDDYLFYACYYSLKSVSKSLLRKSTFSEITQLSDFLLNARNREPIIWF